MATSRRREVAVLFRGSTTRVPLRACLSPTSSGPNQRLDPRAAVAVTHHWRYHDHCKFRRYFAMQHPHLFSTMVVATVFVIAGALTTYSVSAQAPARPQAPAKKQKPPPSREHLPSLYHPAACCTTRSPSSPPAPMGDAKALTPSARSPRYRPENRLRRAGAADCRELLLDSG